MIEKEKERETRRARELRREGAREEEVGDMGRGGRAEVGEGVSLFGEGIERGRARSAG